MKKADKVAQPKELEKKAIKKTPAAKDSVNKKSLAKAGKRSAKAAAEIEEKKAKEVRKKTTVDKKTSPASPNKRKLAKPPRSRLERAGKKYQKAAKLIEPGKTYSLADAMELVTKTSTTKFDATVEMHLNLNVDPKQADQNVRESVVLPAGSGKQIRVAVIAEPADSKKAKDAGADIAGLDEVFQRLDNQDLDFDVLITTPLLMSRLAKYAKTLGPKGLMPSPKSGTVVSDVAKAVKETKSGKIEYRVDTAGIVHLGIGKISFGPQKLILNAETILASLKSAKPPSVKGSFITSCYLTSTMGPSIRLDLSN